MNIIFHKHASLEANIVLEFSPDDYISCVELAIRKHHAQTALKGFRKGQAPYGLIKKMYGPAILLQTIKELAARTLHKYVQEQQLTLWGDPLMVENTLYNSAIDIDNLGVLQIKFECGLLPEVNLSTLHQIDVDNFEIKHIAEKTVMEAIKKARLRYGSTKEVTTSKVEDNVCGMLTGAAGFKEAVYFPADSRIGETNIHFLGLQIQDKVTLHFTPNQSYAVPDPDPDPDIHLPYKEALALVETLTGTYEFTVEKIFHPLPAKLDEAFFSKIFKKEKISSVEEFKERFRTSLITHAQVLAAALLATTIQEAVLTYVTFDLPEDFIKKRLKIKYPEWEEALINNFYEYVQSTLRWDLITQKLAQENDLQVTVDEIMQVIQTKFSHNKLPDQSTVLPEPELRKKVESFLHGEIEQPYKEIYNWVFQEKVLDILKAKLNLHTQEKSVEEFNAILATISPKASAF